jgi:uncharacterized protein YodC (DUF2158 family)
MATLRIRVGVTMATLITFSVGDIVHLKSGGPPMTVVRDKDEKGCVHVAWFDGAKANEGTVDVRALKSPPPEPIKLVKFTDPRIPGVAFLDPNNGDVYGNDGTLIYKREPR